MLTLPWPCSRVPSPACQARTTRSTPRCLSPASPARVRWTEVTTRTPRPSARRSTSARLMAPEVSPSTASSAPTEPSSTRTTSSAPPLRTSTPSTTRSLQRGKLWLERHPTPLETMQLLLLSTVLRDPELLSTRLLPGGDVSRVAEGGRAKHLQLAPIVPSFLVTAFISRLFPLFIP